jgi:hypothetical protein
MTFKRGMRRLALFVGVLGAIVGGTASYFDLQSLFEQSARHKAFEQFANSAVVQAERKRLQTPDPYATYGGKEIKQGEASLSYDAQGNPIPPYGGKEMGRQGTLEWDAQGNPIQSTSSGNGKDKGSAAGTVKSPKPTEDLFVRNSPVPPPPPGFIPLDHSDVNKGGIKSIFWANNYEVKSLDTEDGQSLFPETAPSFWRYLLAVTFPFLGFFAPWGMISALIWVGAGFVEAPK